VLRDRFLEPRRLLAALGVEGGDVIDEALEPATVEHVEPAATDPDARRAQVEAFLAAAGG
jgi:hypothetical protein